MFSFKATIVLATLTTTGLASPTLIPAQSNILSTRGEQHVGDCTYYFLGLGACGSNHGGEDDTANIVAISDEIMGFGPTLANDPFCGRQVTVEANGKSVEATVADKCPGCSVNDIDVSRKIFVELFGTTDVGRAMVTWTLHD